MDKITDYLEAYIEAKAKEIAEKEIKEKYDNNLEISIWLNGEISLFKQVNDTNFSPSEQIQKVNLQEEYEDLVKKKETILKDKLSRKIIKLIEEE